MAKLIADFLDVKDDRAIIAVAVGSGLVARCAVAARADFLLALTAGTFRTLGRGTLASFMPYANSNQQTLTLLREQILPQAGGVPVVAGVCASDPTLDLDSHLQALKMLGVCGITNWPAIGFIDGSFRQAIENAGWGTSSEIQLLQKARAMGLVSCGFVLEENHASAFSDACDVMILNMGLTYQVEDIPNRQDQVRKAIADLNRMVEVVRRAGHRPTCLAFGGPVTTAEDLEQLLRQSDVDGFAGGSVFERLPVQGIIETTVRRFKSVAFRSRIDYHELGSGELIGRSDAMRHLMETVRRIAPYDVNVLIHGETGTGKELVATQIHRLSPRARGPMVTLNCGAIPDALLESELFGHERGAFTGAERRRLGKFELAHHGTLFLDEIADMSPRGQVALLRAIQTGEIARIGSEHRINVDVRIIAASHQNLAHLVAAGQFREDLYYRLNPITVDVPPLVARLDDIPLLVDAILQRLRVRLNREIAGLSKQFFRRLAQHHWPGNVRELEHVVCRAAILETNPVLDGTTFTPSGGAARNPVLPADGAVSSKAGMARQALARTHGNKSQAANLLNVSRKTLYAWLASDSG